MLREKTPDLFSRGLLDAPLEMPGEGLPREMCVASAPARGTSVGMVLTLPARSQEEAFSLLETWYGSAERVNEYSQVTLNIATGLSETLLANMGDADEKLAEAISRLPKGKLGPQDIEGLNVAIGDAKAALSRSKGLRIPGYTLQLNESRDAVSAALAKAEGNLTAYERLPNEKLRKAARSARNKVASPTGQYLRASEKAAVLLRNASAVVNFSGRVMAALPIGAATFDLLAAKTNREKEKAARRLIKPATDLAMGEIVTFLAPRAAIFILTPIAPGVLTVVAVSIGITALGIYGASQLGNEIKKKIELTP